MAWVFYGFRVMYVMGIAMFTIAVVSLWLRWHGRLYTTRWFLKTLVVMTPSGVLATLGGWYTAEIGRQPYVIYGLLRTADAVSPLPAATLLSTLIAFVCAYALFFSAFLTFTLRLIRRGPAGLAAHAMPAGSLKGALRPGMRGASSLAAAE
jgi:cytochrome d ubiquinol oxidase subunit I